MASAIFLTASTLALYLLLARPQQRLHGGFPGRESFADLIVVELVKSVSVESDPGAVREVLVHHLFPQPDGQLEFRLFLPGDPGGLQPPAIFRVEDRAAEQELERHLTVFEGIKVLGCDDLEVVGARNRHVHDRAPRESGNLHDGVGPEQAPQRILPPARLAEQLQEPLLLRSLVVPLGGRDTNLGVQGDGADRLIFQILDTQLEQEARDGGEFSDFGALYPELQIRHGQPPSAAWFLVSWPTPFQAGGRFGLFGSIGFLFSGLMPVDLRAVDLAPGRPAPYSPAG